MLHAVKICFPGKHEVIKQNTGEEKDPTQGCGLTAEVGWVLERDRFLLHSPPWFSVALAQSLWLVFGSCWKMEVSSWQEVSSASQCLLSVGLSTPAACRRTH